MDDGSLPKHTPGPWSVDPLDQFMVTADIDGMAVSATDYSDRTENGQAAANAHLIAAAPDLLQALKFVVGDFTPENEFRVHRDTIGICRAAIAKATGA